MPELILIRGLPGSGKSTLANRLLKALKAHDGHYINEEDATLKWVHFEQDMYHLNEEGEYEWKAENMMSAVRWCFNSTNYALVNGTSVIVSNTFVERAHLQPYLNLAKELDVKVTVITCEQQFESVHNVPEATMARFKARWQSLNP